MTIPDKDTFKLLSARGLLGNTFCTFDSVRDIAAAHYTGWLTRRAREASNRKLFIPALPALKAYALGDNPQVYYQEIPAPDTQRIINLEAMPDVGGLYVRYALNDPTNLRHSLEQRGKDVHGLRAWAVLETYLQEDLDTLRDIWTEYPDAVIECSRFDAPVGVLDRQLVVWEARCY